MVSCWEGSEASLFHAGSVVLLIVMVTFSGTGGFLCFLVSMERCAFHLLEVALGPYSSKVVSEWSVPEGFDAVEAASRMQDVPDVWTDGSGQRYWCLPFWLWVLCQSV